MQTARKISGASREIYNGQTMKRAIIVILALLTIAIAPASGALAADRPQSFGTLDFWPGAVLRYHVQVDPIFFCDKVTYVTVINRNEHPTAHFTVKIIEVYPCVGDVFSSAELYVYDGTCTPLDPVLVRICNANAPPLLFAVGDDVAGDPQVKYLDGMVGYTYLPFIRR